MFTDKKKRTANFSNNEKNILSELVIKYKNIIENKRTDATTNAQKVVGWARLAEKFNSICAECYRNPNALKTCWENIKRNVKKEKACRKKEFFKTGGGKSQSPPNNSNNIVEAVLGPGLEGLPNIYDSDAVQELITNEPETIAPSRAIYSQLADIESDDIQNIGEKEKENSEPAKCDSQFVDQKPLPKNDETWGSWTPTSLKRPLAEPLQNSRGKWIQRRRPAGESLADIYLKEKIDLVKILKQNASEEGNLRLEILKEQLKQEKLKTENICKIVT